MPTDYKSPVETAEVSAGDGSTPAPFEAAALQRAIFNSPNFSSIATDAKGVIKIFNAGAERMLGQEQDLLASYQLGVNAYVVKPMKFQDFVDAVKQVGGFWAVINELPGALRQGEGSGA